jgi:hypothetical protein
VAELSPNSCRIPAVNGDHEPDPTNHLVSAAALCVADYLGQPQADSAPGKSVSILRGGDAWSGSSSRVSRKVESPASEQHPASAGAVLIDTVTRVRDDALP